MNGMTCREFDEVVHGYVRMELLDVRLREAALEHTINCSMCAERMLEAIALADASSALAGQMRNLQAPPPVEDAVLSAFRAHTRRKAWRRTFRWVAVGSAAAALLIVFWTLGLRSKTAPQPSQMHDGASHTTVPLDANGACLLYTSDAADE